MMAAHTDAGEILAANLERALLEAEGDLELTRTEALEWLAIVARVPAEDVHAYVAGTAYPCPRTLGRLAVGIGTTVDALLTESEAT